MNPAADVSPRSVPESITAEGLSSVVFASLREVIGPEDLGQLLLPSRTHDQSSSPYAAIDLLALTEKLRSTFGERGAQGLARKAGRSAFLHWLRSFGVKSHLSDPAFRLQPATVRLRAGLETLAQAVRSNWGVQIKIDEDENSWLWQVKGLPHNQTQSHPCLTQFEAGFLQEFFSWASGGKYYPLSERPCLPDEMTDTIVILKQPID